MTFTFDLSGGFDDLARVRFALGDVDAAAPIFDDETILAVIADKDGSWAEAAVALIDNLVAQLAATPSFTADWLKLDPAAATRYYSAIRARIVASEGLDDDGMTLSGSVIAPTRGDRE